MTPNALEHSLRNVTITSNAKTTTKVLTIKARLKHLKQLTKPFRSKKIISGAPLEMKSK